MAITRGIYTRLVEGLVRNFRLDSDLFTLFGGAGTPAVPTTAARIYKGPLLGLDPSPLEPMQMHIWPGVDLATPGLGNASTVEYTIIVSIYDHFDLQFPAEGSPVVWGPDYLDHCIKLVFEGGDGTTANNKARIVDPDDAGVMLNNSVLRLDRQPFFTSVKDVAIIHQLLVVFETRVNQSLTRV